MNQLSLQVMTWGMVSTAVSTAVWLAMVGDAATLSAATREMVESRATKATPPPILPVVFRPAALPPRADGRTPVVPQHTPLRPRTQS
jgi:hypothetical protein